MQCLEDVICLVFLQYYLDDFAKRHNKEKIIAILRRTWRKMSPRGQTTALSRPMPEQTKMLVEEALSSS